MQAPKRVSLQALDSVHSTRLRPRVGAVLQPALSVQVVVSGLHSNNTANILGSFAVCNSTVFITDLVLLPADSLNGIPLAPATATRTRAGAPLGLLHGVNRGLQQACSTARISVWQKRRHRCQEAQ